VTRETARSAFPNGGEKKRGKKKGKGDAADAYRSVRVRGTKTTRMRKREISTKGRVY